MKENFELEKFQKEAYNDVVATYLFDVEVAGKKSEISNQLAVKKSGIVLHFLRYGIFNPHPFYLQKNYFVRAPEKDVQDDGFIENPDAENNYNLSETIVKAKRTQQKPVSTAPNLSYGTYERTGLRPGYLYILHDDTKQWIEYKINLYGFLYPIYWEHNKQNGTYNDIRDVVSNEKKTSYTVKPDTVVWIAYSPVQWSITQLKQIQASPQEDERMQKIVCKGYKKDKKTKETLTKSGKNHHPYNSFISCFTYQTYSEALRLKETLNIVSKIENSNETTEDELLEDMFITLHDPIGCAYDLVNIINNELTFLSAMVESLATSVHTTDLYKYKIGLLEYGEPKSEVISKEEAEELSYIFATALTTYKFIYNNKELKENYTREKGKWYLNHGISVDHLDKILAISKRKELRKKINKLRDDLGNLLKGSYYTNAISICTKHKPNPLTNIEGKNIVSDHLLCLANYPKMVDRVLLTDKEYNPLADTWVKEIIKTSKGNSIFTQINELLFSPIEITQLEKQDTKDWKYITKFNGKLFSHLKKMIEAYIAFNKAIKVSLLRNQFDFVTRINDKGVKESYLVTAGKNLIYQDFLDDFEKIKKNIASKNPVHKRIESIDHAKIPITYWLLVEEEFKGEINAKMATHFKNNEKISIHVKGQKQLPYAKKLDNIINSQQFRGTVLVFEMFSLMEHIGNMLQQETLSNEDKLKLTGMSIKATSAGLNLAESMSKDITQQKINQLSIKHPINYSPKTISVVKKIEKSSFANRGETIIKSFGLLASVYSIIASIQDTTKALANNDNDAALAYSGAAALAVVSFLGSLKLISLTGMPGIIVAGLGFALYGLAYYLTDDELETFFKHFPFSSQTVWKSTGNNEAYSYARAMYKNKELFINKLAHIYLPKTKEKSSYKHIFVRLTNLIAGCNIRIKAGTGSYNSPRSLSHTLSPQTHPNWVNKNASIWSTLAIDISFGSFLTDSTKLSYEVYIVQKNDPLLGNKSYQIPQSYVDAMLTAPAQTTEGNVTFLEQTTLHGNINATFKKLHIWLRIPKYIELQRSVANNNTYKKQLFNKHYLNEHSHIAILCKYTDGTIKLPLQPNDTQGYLYNLMPLRVSKSNHILAAERNIWGNTAIIIGNKDQFFTNYPLQN